MSDDHASLTYLLFTPPFHSLLEIRKLQLTVKKPDS